MENKDLTLTTPILFLVFNRPEKTQRVFEEIRKVRPRKLYVAADAPRPENQNDLNKCEAVRRIVKQVDWDCDAKYLFHSNNLGCCLAGKTAWDWIFSQEEEMIFLEDDGMPSTSFFYYCQELLRYYKDNDKIAYIGGVNYQVYSKDNNSYFFSRYCPPTYGMATWKRVYDLYEYNIDSYKSERAKKDFRKRFWWCLERDMFIEKYDNFVKSIENHHRYNTYDRQMSYLCWKYGKYNIHPNYNLVTNIGFDADGTNTPDNPELAEFFSRPVDELTEIVHPNSIAIDKKTEKKLFVNKVLFRENYFKSFCKYYFYRIAHKIHHIFD